MTTILSRNDSDTLSHHFQVLSITPHDGDVAKLRSLLYSDCNETMSSRLATAALILNQVTEPLSCTVVQDVLEALPQYISDSPESKNHAISLLDLLLLKEWDYANVPQLSKQVERIIAALKTLEHYLEKESGCITSEVAAKEIPLLVKRMHALVPEVTIETVRRKVLEKNELFSSINKYSRHLNEVNRIKYFHDAQALANITLSNIPDELHLRVIDNKICVYTASKLRALQPIQNGTL